MGEAEAEFEVPVVAPDGVKDLLDRGYTIMGIRSPQEVAETGSKRIWEKIPLAADDGTERTEIAADFLNDEGYTAVQAIDGGIDQYLEESPSRRRTRLSGRY